MWGYSILVAWSLLGCSLQAARADNSSQLSSHLILPSNFKPPQVFKNTNLVRTISLEKGYAKVTVNVVIENTDKVPQSQYFLPFKPDQIGNIGGLEVKDKNEPEKPAFLSEVVEYDPGR